MAKGLPLIGRFFGRTISDGAAFAMGASTARTLHPLLQDVANETWNLHPDAPLNPVRATETEIAGGWSADEVRQELRYNGLNKRRADAMRATAGTAPGIAMLAELRNRDLIDDAAFERGMGQLGVRNEWRDDVRQLRFQLPSGDDLAQMAVQGVLEHNVARDAAEKVGTTNQQFERLFLLHGQPPAAEQLLSLWNRRAIGEDDVDRGLRQSRLKPEWVDAVKVLKNVLVPVSDLVRFAVREVFNPAQRAALDLDAEYPSEFGTQASRLGLSDESARDYWAAHWQLPSYEQGAEMLHRRQITPEQFQGLLKALDYAPTWRDKLRTIAEHIPPISDMIRFAVREVYSPAQRASLGLDADYPDDFTAEAALHGMDEERAKQYWAAHWRLPSALQGYRMLWREEIEPGELDGLLKALDYPKKWRDKLRNIAFLVPGRIDTRRMLAAGIIGREEAISNYRHLGYTQRDAERLVQLASVVTGTTEKEASAADEATLYSGGRTTRAEYVARLQKLGYSAAEATRKADVTEARHIVSAQTSAIGGLRTMYKKDVIDAARARTALLALRLPDWTADGILAMWKVEHDAPPPPATAPPVVPAVTPPPPAA